MKLHGMAEAFQTQMETADMSQLGFEERFALLVDRQWLWKENLALARRLRAAHLKERGVIEDVDYHHPRRLDRKLMRTLAERMGAAASEYSVARAHRDRQELAGLGAGAEGVPGWIFGAHKRTTELFRDLEVAHADGSIGRVLLKLSRIDVLVLDDFAMAPMKDVERRDFLEICDDRYQNRSMVLTSQVPTDHWHEQIGDPTIADSILDRLVHNAHRIELDGESMRKGRGGKPPQE
jgi:hypothetical protein